MPVTERYLGGPSTSTVSTSPSPSSSLLVDDSETTALQLHFMKVRLEELERLRQREREKEKAAKKHHRLVREQLLQCERVQTEQGEKLKKLEEEVSALTREDAALQQTVVEVTKTLETVRALSVKSSLEPLLELSSNP